MEKEFYNSEAFHKSLGIKNFISCTDLQICKQKDREMVDKVIFNTIIKQLKNAKQPEFIFALTLSQHSPHAKSANTVNLKCTNSMDSSLCDNFSEYIKREENLQFNIDQFINQINELNKDSIIVFFGDHIASSFTSIKEPDLNNENQYFKTIAFAYDSREKRFFNLKENLKNCSPNFNLNVSDLDVLALKKANFHSKYIDEKFQLIQKNCVKN
jgi:phosphoglycerol transferase MdoB-like AlkP superfamily enzyme